MLLSTTCWAIEDELAFLTLLHAAAPDAFEHLVGFVQAARPLQQQGALDRWSKHQGREDLGVLQLHGATELFFVEAFAAEEPQDHAHTECQAQQVRLVDALGLGDGLLGHLHAGLGLIGLEQCVGQGDQDLRAQRAVGVHLAERALQQAGSLEEAVAVQSHDSKPAQRLCSQVAGRQSIDGLLEHGARSLVVACVEMV